MYTIDKRNALGFGASLISLLAVPGCSKRFTSDQFETIYVSASTPAPPARRAPTESVAERAPSAPSSATFVEAPTPGEAARRAGLSGTLTATPNPVPLCDKSGLGVTTISFTAVGTKMVEVHVDAPDGTLFLATHELSGQQKTDQWVKAGTTFFLQDGGSARSSDYTLARLTVRTLPGGPCPSAIKESPTRNAGSAHSRASQKHAPKR